MPDNHNSSDAILSPSDTSQRSEGISKLFSSAVTLFEHNDLPKARKILRKIVKQQPSHTDALFYLGIIAGNQKHYDEAIGHYETVISLDPGYVNAYFNLGGVFINQGKYDQAHEQFDKVIALSPGYANAYFNLGVIASNQNKLDEALEHYRKVISIEPENTDAYCNAGCMLMDLKRQDEAVPYLEKALSLDPEHLQVLANLGCIELNRNNHEKAEQIFNTIISLNPSYDLAYNNLGLIYHSHYHQLDTAISYYEKALSANPGFSDAWLNMGNIYRERGNHDKAAECYARSLEAKESLVGLVNASGLHKEMCNFQKAFDLTMKMLSYEGLKKSELAGIHDTFIQICEWEKASQVIDRFRKEPIDPEGRNILAGSFMEFCAITDLSLDEISELHKQWGQLTEQNVVRFTHDSPGQKSRLRIGYVSPDLREHSVGYLIKDIIASHNYNEFEVYCYANFNPDDSDAFTQEMINSCTVFKYIKHLSDREVADEIYNDHIDILIDLAGHTAGHRLRSFACKPAPIQITYLGYPNTTGLSAIDYRITDYLAESGREFDYRYSEKLLRLTNCFLTFMGFEQVPPSVTYAKGKDDPIIFGCFNNIQKLSPKAIELWARILDAVPGSRLHLKAKQLNTPMVWNNIAAAFAGHGISADRLKCLGYTATRQEHLNLYNSIDIALDTFPYNGTVTTLEALWMNIPVVTLAGESHAQRVGYSILKNLDLDQLAAFTEDDYVSICVGLARDAGQIVELKKRMRQNLLASSICNPNVITREMELNYKTIWLEYATRQSRAQASADDRRPSGPVEGAISASSRLRMAMVKLQAGDFQRAVDISSELTADKNISPLALYVQGASLNRLGRTDEAVACLNRSVEQDPGNTGALKLLGEIYLAIDRIDKANTCLLAIWNVSNRLNGKSL